MGGSVSQLKPLCFVLMPFGRKSHGSGRTVDFDAVYDQILGPAAVAAGMEVIRADQEQVGGTIHKPMYERLMLSDFALADVTGANPNVYYELGIRHALRPRSTVMVFAEGTNLPFDVASQRGTPYHMDDSGKLTDVAGDVQRITERLRSSLDDAHDDSPLFQLIDGMPRHEIDHIKTDVFRDRVAIAQDYKKRLMEARTQGRRSGARRRRRPQPQGAELRRGRHHGRPHAVVSRRRHRRGLRRDGQALRAHAAGAARRRA